MGNLCIKRILAKNNYIIHTDAIKNYILPGNDYYKNREWIKYAEEADILNVSLFNTTAKRWGNLILIWQKTQMLEITHQ